MTVSRYTQGCSHLLSCYGLDEVPRKLPDGDAECRGDGSQKGHPLGKGRIGTLGLREMLQKAVEAGGPVLRRIHSLHFDVITRDLCVNQAISSSAYEATKDLHLQAKPHVAHQLIASKAEQMHSRRPA